MLPQHSPRPFLEKRLGPCVLEQILPVVTLSIFGLRRPRNEPPLHDLKLFRARYDDAVRLGIGGDDVDLLGQPNVIKAHPASGSGVLTDPCVPFLLGENLPGSFDNIQLLTVPFGYGRCIC